jgi:CBS-domain-containing membrane protein
MRGHLARLLGLAKVKYAQRKTLRSAERSSSASNAAIRPANGFTGGRIPIKLLSGTLGAAAVFLMAADPSDASDLAQPDTVLGRHVGLTKA